MKQTLFDNMKNYYRQQCENRQEQLIGLYLRQEHWEKDVYKRQIVMCPGNPVCLI